VEYQQNNKRREKLEDIDVNIEEQSLQHMTRTMKRKLQEENHTVTKKTNVVHVPLEKQISTPLKPIEDVLQTPHQIRENEAEQRKELYLKSRADQKYLNIFIVYFFIYIYLRPINTFLRLSYKFRKYQL